MYLVYIITTRQDTRRGCIVSCEMLTWRISRCDERNGQGGAVWFTSAGESGSDKARNCVAQPRRMAVAEKM